DRSDWVRFFLGAYSVGGVGEFGPANDIEISSGDRVASDPDRSPLLIALYPRGDNAHKIAASRLDRLGKRERKNLPVFGRLIFIPGRLISHWRISPMEKLRRVSASAELAAPQVSWVAPPRIRIWVPRRRRNADLRFRLPAWRT